jgi:hypothetical protein
MGKVVKGVSFPGAGLAVFFTDPQAAVFLWIIEPIAG